MKENDIRPQAIFDEYLRLAELDVDKYFHSIPRKPILCPACNHSGEDAFVKNGFNYQLCPLCDTLFVSPRPPASAFERYYTESESTKYWATTFYKETAEARREKLWQPKARTVQSVMKQNDADGHVLVDIGGGYGLFAEEMIKLTHKQVTVIEPSPHMASECREKGLQVKECFLEALRASELPDSPKVFVSFELFEHLHDPGIFLDHLFKLMHIGDLFIFTTLSGTGIDIQVLWEKSKSVSPPHHLNFFNPYSVKLILESHNFDTLDISTPGMLDMDILSNNQVQIRDRFWRTFFKRTDLDQTKRMQQTLVELCYSSHMMVVSRKTKEK